MAKRNVRRPTEDMAIARVTAQKDKGPQGDPTLLQKTVMDTDGSQYIIWCFHTHVNTSITFLWNQWRRDWNSIGTFVDFLALCGIIYKHQRVSRGAK